MTGIVPDHLFPVIDQPAVKIPSWPIKVQTDKIATGKFCSYFCYTCTQVFTVILKRLPERF